MFRNSLFRAIYILSAMLCVPSDSNGQDTSTVEKKRVAKTFVSQKVCGTFSFPSRITGEQASRAVTSGVEGRGKWLVATTVRS
jgi:hypothetical protein